MRPKPVERIYPSKFEWVKIIFVKNVILRLNLLHHKLSQLPFKSFLLDNEK